MSVVKKIVGFVCTTCINSALVEIHGRPYCPQFALGIIRALRIPAQCFFVPQRAESVGVGGGLVHLLRVPTSPEVGKGPSCLGIQPEFQSVLSLGSCFHSYVTLRLRKGIRRISRTEDMGKKIQSHWKSQ